MLSTQPREAEMLRASAKGMEVETSPCVFQRLGTALIDSAVWVYVFISSTMKASSTGALRASASSPWLQHQRHQLHICTIVVNYGSTLSRALRIDAVILKGQRERSSSEAVQGT